MKINFNISSKSGNEKANVEQLTSAERSYQDCIFHIINSIYLFIDLLAQCMAEVHSQGFSATEKH